MKNILRYLKTIAGNLNKDQIGKAKRTIYVDQFLEIEAKTNPYILIDLENDLQSKLTYLSCKQQEVLKLRIEGYTYSDIAEKMSMKLDTVRKVIYRYRVKLKRSPD